MNVRKAMFMGSWYPGSASSCEREINSFLGEDGYAYIPRGNFKGGIVPHAGWYFSGSIACNVIHCLKEERSPDVILIFGMHLHADSPNIIMTEGAWETPFGHIVIASELATALNKRFEFQIETTEHFTQDNTIELQLPFIRFLYPDVQIVPIGVPPSVRSLEIGKVAVEIADQLGLHIKIIGTTDLTHYGRNYGFAPEGTGNHAVNWVRDDNDRKIIEAMMALDPERVIGEALTNQNACCAGAAATAIAAGKQMGSEKSHTVGYATSFDKSPGDSFVGYVGIVF
ncbi:MAG: AmmeMemoRadiSam system protein B [Desulfobacterales bacterium]|nr:AmmeMemoRadiSam system protein B [Desulfobacterales bacterium]